MIGQLSLTIAICILYLAFASALEQSNVSGRSTTVKCPCMREDLCLPINNTRKEIFAFSVKNDASTWKMYDWTKLTTVVMVGYFNTSLMCLAHANQARVSYIANSNSVNFTDPSSRKSWISQQMIYVEKYFLDGLNFDFEGAISKNDSANRMGYTSLVAETQMAFKEKYPFFQVTVDVPWKQNVDIRYFDFNGLAKNSDFLFVMAYDEQSQIFGECIAGPNCGFSRTFQGITDYVASHIGPEKLVLGIPWYGYTYQCLEMKEEFCFLKHVPFRGVNCSDAAGKELDYSNIVKLIKQQGAEVKWNSSSQTPYFSYQDAESNFHQIQFDNPKSLTLKYHQAVKDNLRGVGMWTIDSLDYSDTPDGRIIREAMFGALPDYKAHI